MIIKYPKILYKLLKNKFYLVYLLKNNKQFLETGKYYLKTNSLICHENLNNFNINNINIDEKSNKYKLLNKITKKYYYISNNESKQYRGQMLMISGYLNEFKKINIFDYKNEVIIKKFLSKSGFKKNLNNYNYLSKTYNLPKIIDIDKESNIIIQELVNSGNLLNVSDDKIDDCISKNFKYILKHYKSNRNNDKYFNIYDGLIRLKKDNSFNLIYELINKHIKINEDDLIPQIISHGDILFKNLLYDEKENNLYYIDYELTDYYSILFELCHWMDQYYRKYNDNKYIINFFKGEYDLYFIEIFEEYNLVYNKAHKLNYFIFYLIEFICKRYLFKNNGKKRRAKNFYDYLEMVFDLAKKFDFYMHFNSGSKSIRIK